MGREGREPGTVFHALTETHWNSHLAAAGHSLSRMVLLPLLTAASAACSPPPPSSTAGLQPQSQQGPQPYQHAQPQQIVPGQMLPVLLQHDTAPPAPVQVGIVVVGR